jgi:membrane protein YdbS with pleckstrin-like domain
VSNEYDEPGHANSPAAWIAVVVMLVGVTGGTLAFWFEVEWLVWAFVGLIVLGFLIGLMLARLGYGVKGPRYVPKVHS